MKQFVVIERQRPNFIPNLLLSKKMSGIPTSLFYEKNALLLIGGVLILLGLVLIKNLEFMQEKSFKKKCEATRILIHFCIQTNNEKNKPLNLFQISLHVRPPIVMHLTGAIDCLLGNCLRSHQDEKVLEHCKPIPCNDYRDLTVY